LDVADEEEGHLRDVVRVVRRRFRYARHRHVGVADRLDALTSELFHDPVERREDVVEFGDERGRVLRGRDLGEPHEVEHEDRRLLEALGRGHAEGLDLLVDLLRHDVEEQLLRAFLLPLELPVLLLDHGRVGLDHVLELLHLRDVLGFEDEELAALAHVLGDVQRDGDLTPTRLELRLAGVGPTSLQAALEFRHVEVREGVGEEDALPLDAEPVLEAGVVEDDPEALRVQDREADAHGLEKDLVEAFDVHGVLPGQARDRDRGESR
jgi:hypothetical protein